MKKPNVYECMKVLGECHGILAAHYDSDEDNKSNPPMQQLGRVMERARQLLERYRGSAHG
jgi:hypothetical protein